MRIIVADDHALFRDMLKEYILKVDSTAEVVLAGSLNEAIDKLEDLDGDVDMVMLDILMPGMDGLRGISLIKHKYPKIKVAIISGTIESEMALDAIKLGAIGYFPKTLSAVSFVPALKLVLSGQQYLPTDLSSPSGVMRSYYGQKKRAVESYGSAPVHEDAIGWKALNDDSPMKELTKREREVLLLIAQGLTNKEIGDDLDIKEVTVKLHVGNIYKKLKLRNRSEATNFINRLKAS